MSYKYPRTYPNGAKKYSLKKDGNKQLSEHFKVKEFKCKDGSDEIVIHDKLIDALEQLFIKLNAKAINITSGYRTVSHSLAVGGKGEADNHHMGMAADIKVKGQDGKLMSSKNITLALEDMNYQGGIGLINKTTAVHIDVGSQYWFDETNKSAQVPSWYDYWKVKKPTETKPIEHKGTCYIITCQKLKVRTAPTTLSKQVGMYYKNDKIYVIAKQGNWYQLESGNWMCAKNYSKRA